MRLFELPPLEPDEDASHAHRHSALGTAAELLLTSRLIELGHRVAVPVVDDDGVDLVVNYNCKVQVKSSACRTATGTLWINLSTLRSSERKQRGNWIRPHIDIVAVYARDTRAWWLVPQEHMPPTHLHVCERGKESAWHEAWHVFNQTSTALTA